MSEEAKLGSPESVYEGQRALCWEPRWPDTLQSMCQKKKNGRMTVHFIKTPGSVGLKPTMTQPYDSIAQDTSSSSPSGKPESAADVRKCEQASHQPISA